MSPAVARKVAVTNDRLVERIDRDLWARSAYEKELDLDDLIFNWVKKGVTDLDVRGAITSITLERTIEGASTVEITLQDPDSRLLGKQKVWEPKPKKGKKRDVDRDVYGSAIVKPLARGRTMEIRLDGVVYRLVKLSKNGDDVSLTFEDRVVYWLRRKGGANGKPRRVNRSKVTRAQFILSLVRELKSERVRFVCPDLNVKQPIDQGATNTSVRHKKGGKSKGKGLEVGGDVTVKGRRATAEQRRIGERVLAVANDLDAGSKATLALIEACIVESMMTNIPTGLSSSVGILQLLDIHGPVSVRMNVEHCVKLFLTRGFTGRGGAIALARQNPNASAGQIAQMVQGSAFPTAYDEVRSDAIKWLDGYAGSGSSIPEADAAGGRTRYKSYQFARNKDEDSWTAIQRLANEVGWRAFMQGRSFFYMSEDDLYRRKPLHVIRASDPAILGFDFAVDWGRPVSEARVSVVAGKWTVPPGEPVTVKGYGPADGRWLCVAWRRDYFSPVAEVILRQPGREQLEPAPESETIPGSSSSGVSVEFDGDAPERVLRAYRRADAIDKKAQAYVWGGGHGTFNDSRGYDCSGFVSSCLNAGGMLSTPQATPGLIGWGQPGKGKSMTVYVLENGNAHMSHTFIVFTIGGRVRYAEAGGAESGRTGWHRPRSTSGFSARHWPGT